MWRWTLEEVDRFTTESRVGSVPEDKAGADDKSEGDLDFSNASMSEEDPEPNELGMNASGLEESHRDLLSVLRVIQGQKAALFERGGYLEARLNSAEERVKRVLGRVSNVDGLVHVTDSQLFGSGDGEVDEKKRMSKSLRHFISGNFARQNSVAEVPDMQALDSPESPSSPRTPAARTPSKGGRVTWPDEEAAPGAARADGAEKSLASREVCGNTLGEVLAELKAEGGADNWAIDMLALHKRTGRRALLLMAELHAAPHARELGTKEKTMRNFTSELHRRYEENQNSFHNEAHAAMVCHATHWLATRCKAWNGMSLWMRLATDLAAMAHDVGHFGRNNAFCSTTGHQLALIYNDRSICENMHASTCFQAMQVKGCNILSDAPKELKKPFREHIVGLILATDMAEHFEFLGRLRVKTASAEFNPQEHVDDRRLLTHAYVKAADLGHTALPFDLHQQWALRVLTEFYEQGDEERQLGLAVSPMCERTGNVADFRQSQQGFLQFVVMPLFKELAISCSPEVTETCISRLEINGEEWVRGEPSQDLVAVIQGAESPVASRSAKAFAPPSPNQARTASKRAPKQS